MMMISQNERLTVMRFYLFMAHVHGLASEILNFYKKLIWIIAQALWNVNTEANIM